MARTEQLVAALKTALKARGLTYADVAERLQLSQGSVKRMFATRHFTLQRLEAVCTLADLDLGDLVRAADNQGSRLSRLSEGQELELVSDPKLLLVATCVRDHWSFDEIVRHHELSAPECLRLLVRLDRLKLIELLPGNRIRLLVAPDFRWIPGGPIERFFEQRVQTEFLDSEFNAPGAYRVYLHGALSRVSQELLLRRLARLAGEFGELLKEDTAQPIDARGGYGMVLAFRPFEFSAFTSLRRRY